MQQEEPLQKRERVERVQSPTSSSNVWEVEMFAQENPTNPPLGNIPALDILSISASHKPNQPRSQRQESPPHQEETRQDSLIEAILGKMEEESQEQEQMEIRSHSIPTLDCLMDRLRREPEKEINPARELEELLKKNGSTSRKEDSSKNFQGREG